MRPDKLPRLDELGKYRGPSAATGSQTHARQLFYGLFLGVSTWPPGIGPEESSSTLSGLRLSDGCIFHRGAYQEGGQEIHIPKQYAQNRPFKVSFRLDRRFVKATTKSHESGQITAGHHTCRLWMQLAGSPAVLLIDEMEKEIRDDLKDK